MKKSIDSSNSHESHSQYEEYLASIVDTIRESLLVLDKDLRIISANTTFYDQFRVNPKQTENIMVYDIGNGQWDIPELRKLLEEILPTHNPFNNFKVEHTFPHIGRKVMLLNARQIKAQGEWKDRILLAIEDITQFDKDRQDKESGLKRERAMTDELIKSQKEVLEGERRFRILADNIPNLCWMAEPDGYIYWYNKRWYEYTGTTLKDMKGWGWTSIHDPKVLPIVLKQWKEAIASGRSFEMIFPLKRADGTFRPFLTRIVPIYDEAGNVIHWFGTNTDITKQVELEKQKDEFLGIASHELKTPVTSIKIYGQVLKTMFKRKGDMGAVEALQKMDAQVNKLTNLIGDLLDVTKIRTGRLEFHEEYFDFNELVQESVEEMQLTTDKHTIHKNLSKSKNIFGDRERTGQVITNLLANAIKYSPHTRDINVITTLKKDKITMCVQDFGVGIPKNKQDRIFEQFFRVSGPKNSTVPGLGLGLYISSEIIKRQGGRIWVESIEGKGSTFCFSLPIQQKNNKIKQKNTLVEEEIQHE